MARRARTAPGKPALEQASPADFLFDFQQQQARCPAGEFSSSWENTTDRYGKEQVKIKFAVTTCRPCQQREQCTKIDRRILTHSAQSRNTRLGRGPATSPDQAIRHHSTPNVRASKAQSLKQSGEAACVKHVILVWQKRVLQHLLTTTAINIIRLVNWLTGVPLAKTRQSAFVKLMKPVPLTC
ncbi:MAG: transposase [Acidobacteria bacterium]|nr:transposase [Acidobacteriota bacterium]